VKQTGILFFLLVLPFIVTNCSGEKIHPARDYRNYTYPPDTKLEDRVFKAPDFVLDYFTQFDEDIILEDKPYIAYTPTPGEMKEIRSVVRKLPEIYHEKISPRFLGLFFIENMIGSGWTEWIPGPDGERLMIMALDSEVLKLDASDWLTKKEKSAFIIDDPGYDIHIDIGSGMSGFYYIFNHEISHVYDYIEGITPGEPGFDSAREYARLKEEGASLDGRYPLVDGIWKSYSEPVDIYDFPHRKDISFYGLSGGPKINISDAPAVYADLMETPFVTLYGSLSWMEDFVELFAAYMNIEEYGRPWRLTVTHGGETVFEIDAEDVLYRDTVKDRTDMIKSMIE